MYMILQKDFKSANVFMILYSAKFNVYVYIYIPMTVLPDTSGTAAEAGCTHPSAYKILRHQTSLSEVLSRPKLGKLPNLKLK